jgi:adenylate cyclase
VAVEIERKFLVAADPDGADVAARTPIRQGYVAVASDGSELRVRAIGDAFRLTVKSGGLGVRSEHEVEIGAELFDELWALTEGRRLEKERLLIPYDGLTIELDVYGGALRGLRVAEVEFPSVEAAERFRTPPWFGAEVTGDPAYKNQALASRRAPILSSDRGDT